MLESGKPVEEFIKPEDLAGISDEELESLCKEAIDANPRRWPMSEAVRTKPSCDVRIHYEKTGGKADIRKVEVLLRKLIGQ